MPRGEKLAGSYTRSSHTPYHRKNFEISSINRRERSSFPFFLFTVFFAIYRKDFSMINDRYSITIDVRIVYDIVDDRTLLSTEKNSKFCPRTVENEARFHFFCLPFISKGFFNDKWSILDHYRCTDRIWYSRSSHTPYHRKKFELSFTNRRERSSFPFFMFTVFFAIYRKDFSMINDLPSISLSRIS